MHETLERYRALILQLRDARLRDADDGEEDRIEEAMLELWDALTPEERKQTEVWAPEGFPRA